MRVESLFGSALKESPADADLISHQLLLRAGYVRPLGAGIYSALPLAWRSLRRIEAGTGLPVLDLPLETAYHIDLGFDLFGADDGRRGSPGKPTMATPGPATTPTGADAALIAAIQDGLALEPRPYLTLAREVGMERATPARPAL